MLSEGSGSRDWRRIAQGAEDLGASIAAFGDLELQGVAVDSLAADWEVAIDWAAELALESSFPADRCAWSVRQAEGELASLADHPDAATSWVFREQLYAPHPAARPPQGDARSLAAIDSDLCRKFHERSKESGLIVSVAGVVDAEAVERRVRERFAAVAGRRAELDSPPAPAGAEARRAWPVHGDQAHLFMGHLTVARSHPALPALRLLSVILGAGGGLSGRLPHRVREREGLAYSTHVDAAAGAGLDPGRLSVYVGTSPENVERAIRAVTEELQRVLDDGVTDAEVEEARAYLLGREPFRRETARQWADLMAAAVHYDLPLDSPEWVIDRVRAVDREQIERAARELIRPDEIKITVGAPE